MSSQIIATPESIYVADLHVPTTVVDAPKTRIQIPNPHTFGITKGYCSFRSSTVKQEATPELDDLIAVVELVAPCLKVAEDRAIRVGWQISTYISAYFGTPYEEPQLVRIAVLDAVGALKAQHHYQYLPRPATVVSGGSGITGDLMNYIGRLTGFEPEPRERLKVAAHWYGMALASNDSAVSYVSAWTGLESIDPLLDRKWHEVNGFEHCGTCNVQPDEKKSTRYPGIRHAFGLVANETLFDLGRMHSTVVTFLESELRIDLTYVEANDLRNELAHGDRSLTEASESAVIYRRHLIHVLHGSIRHIIANRAPSMVAADHRVRPDCRYSMDFNSAQAKSPYSGEWLPGPQFTVVSQRAQNLSRYYRSVSVDISGDMSLIELIAADCTQLFGRRIDEFDLEEDPFNPKLMPPSPTWEERSEEPNWQPFDGASL